MYIFTYVLMYTYTFYNININMYIYMYVYIYILCTHTPCINTQTTITLYVFERMYGYAHIHTVCSIHIEGAISKRWLDTTRLREGARSRPIVTDIDLVALDACLHVCMHQQTQVCICIH